MAGTEKLANVQKWAFRMNRLRSSLIALLVICTGSPILRLCLNSNSWSGEARDNKVTIHHPFKRSDPASGQQDQDPFLQQFTLLDSVNQTIALTIPDVNKYTQYAIRGSINWGSQIGACVVLLAVLLLVTKREKRRSPIFCFNVLNLALCIVRAFVNVFYFTGNFYDFYSFISGDMSKVTTNDTATSIAASTMNLCLLIGIETSLFLQSLVVCADMKRVYRICIVVLALLASMIAVVFRFILAVLNNEAIMNPLKPIGDSVIRIAFAANVSIATSIGFFSLIFCVKLGLAIRNRRRLGIRQFGPMQIIFIMGAQTMIIPAVCSIIFFYTDVTVQLNSQILTIVAIFLPLSSMWASANVDGSNQVSSARSARNRLFGRVGWKKGFGGRNISSASRHGSTAPLAAPISPASQRSRKTLETYGTDKTELELQDNNGHHGAADAINKVFP